jgi:hypothetical protein
VSTAAAHLGEDELSPASTLRCRSGSRSRIAALQRCCLLVPFVTVAKPLHPSPSKLNPAVAACECRNCSQLYFMTFKVLFHGETYRSSSSHVSELVTVACVHRTMHCLVAIDGSKHGNDALLWTARHLWKDGMQLDVVTGVQQCPAQPILLTAFLFTTRLFLHNSPLQSNCLSFLALISYAVHGWTAVLPSVADPICPFCHISTTQWHCCSCNLAVLPPVAMNVYPVAPVATAAAVAAVTHQWEAQKQHDEAHATEVLREAVQEALEAGVRHNRLFVHQHSYCTHTFWTSYAAAVGLG